MRRCEESPAPTVQGPLVSEWTALEQVLPAFGSIWKARDQRSSDSHALSRVRMALY